MKDPFGDSLKSEEFKNENESKEAHAAAARKRSANKKFEEDNVAFVLPVSPDKEDVALEWQNADVPTREKIIKDLAFLTYAKPKDVSKLFRIKLDELKQYQPFFDSGHAELKLKIQGHNIRWALTTNQPMAKFNMAQQYAGQVANPAHDDVESLDDSRGPKVQIEVLTKPPEPEYGFDSDAEGRPLQ